MNLELHILQSFGPSNLNRDDTGSPKDAIFGGVRRARISSQCLKRSIRRHPSFQERIQAAGGDVGKRTKLIEEELAKKLLEAGVTENGAHAVSAALVYLLGLNFDKKSVAEGKPRTQYLLYLGENEIRDLAHIGARQDVQDAIIENFKRCKDDLEKLKDSVAKEKTLKDIGKELKEVVGSSRLEARAYAADIALFGRMVADDKTMNVDAACQVAHAISTHKASMEIDFYTAVDDFNIEDSGAGMMGTMEYNSSCYYRYANVDVALLSDNLAHNRDLLNATLRGFVEASIKAIPTGKQNSTAAQNAPVYAKVILRNDGFPWALTGAFSRPVSVSPSEDSSLEEKSIGRLEEYLNDLKRVYGEGGIVFESCFSVVGDKRGSLAELLEGLDRALVGMGKNK